MHSGKEKMQIDWRKTFFVGLALLLSFSSIPPALAALLQSHPLSEITPIDVNLNMSGYNITNASYVGIGITIPAYNLHVEGNAYISGPLRVGGLVDFYNDLDMHGNDILNVGNLEFTGGTLGGNLDMQGNNITNVSWINPEGTELRIGGNVYTPNIFPLSAGSYDLGSASLYWRDLYLSGKLFFVPDANLYRYSADLLKTDDSFWVGGSEGLKLNLAGQLWDQSDRTVLRANKDKFDVISQDGQRFIFSASNRFYWYGNDTTIDFVIMPEGKVGIGTATPSHRLEVAGDLGASTIYEGGATLASKYVSRSDWTTHDDYPPACPDGYAVQAIGDTLTCINLNSTGNITGVGVANALAYWENSSSLSAFDFGTSGQFLKSQGSGNLPVWDVIDLGADTQGNYVEGINAGVGISVSGTPGEGWYPTVAIDTSIVPRKNVDESITGSWTFQNDLTVMKNLRVAGNITYVNYDVLHVNGSIIPPLDNWFDIGNSTNRWRNAYFRSEIHVGPATITHYNNNDVWISRHLLLGKDLGVVYPIYADTNFGGIKFGVKIAARGVLPYSDNAYDVGSSSLRFKDAYFAGTVYANKFEGSISANNVEDIWVNESGDTMTGNLNMAADILPTTDNARNLGSPSLQWANIYGVNIYQSGNKVLDTSTSFGGDVSGTYDNLQLKAGVVGNTEINDNTKFVSVQNSTGTEQFAITDGNDALQFVAGDGININFDSTNHRVTIVDSNAGSEITGSGTANYVAKFTGSNTIGNSQIYDDGTNVGIGTNTPSYKLDVAGDIASRGLIYVYLKSLDDVGILFKGTIGAVGGNQHFHFLPDYSAPAAATDTTVFFGYNSNITEYAFLSTRPGTNTKLFVIKGDTGNVGIGAVSPAYKLDVTGTFRSSAGGSNFKLESNGDLIVEI